MKPKLWFKRFQKFLPFIVVMDKFVSEPELALILYYLCMLNIFHGEIHFQGSVGKLKNSLI